MFLEFDNSIINTNAVSEFMRINQDGKFKIVALRTDGSYMGSESFDTVNERETRMSDIYNGLKEN